MPDQRFSSTNMDARATVTGMRGAGMRLLRIFIVDTRADVIDYPRLRG